MTEAPPPPQAEWPRPYWAPGEDSALLVFFIFGRFPEEIVLPAARYGSNGLPEGMEMHRYPNETLATWEGYPLRGALGEVLEHDAPIAFDAAKQAPEVIRISGTLDDRASLDYLRDTLGVLAALLDIGGDVVVDPQILSLFDAPAWRERYLVDGGAPPRNHVVILAHDEEGGNAWVRTRGMRKFGRPDLSIRGVPRKDLNIAGALCERLVELNALGGHLADGQELEVEGIAGPLHCTHGGGLDDPQFNNTYVEVRWPAGS